MTRWNRANLHLGYNRSISNANVLSVAGSSHSFLLSLGRQLGEGTSLSGQANFQRSELLGFREFGRFDQGTLTVNLTRRISASLDFSVFFRYATLLSPVPVLTPLNPNAFGIRFFYHIPRLSSS